MIKKHLNIRKLQYKLSLLALLSLFDKYRKEKIKQEKENQENVCFIIQKS